MRLLLDTHSFLWFVLNEPQLSSTAQSLIGDPRQRYSHNWTFATLPELKSTGPSAVNR